MVRDEEQTMAIVVRRDGDEGTVRAHDKEGKMVMNMNADPKHYVGLAEMIFLSRGCDALILGAPSVKYIRKD